MPGFSSVLNSKFHGIAVLQDLMPFRQAPQILYYELSQFLAPTKNLALKNTLYVVRFVYVRVHTDECVCLGMHMYTVTVYFCVCKHVALTCCPFSWDIYNILCLLEFYGQVICYVNPTLKPTCNCTMCFIWFHGFQQA